MMRWNKRVVAFVMSLLLVVNAVSINAHASEMRDEQIQIAAGMNTAVAPEDSSAYGTEDVSSGNTVSGNTVSGNIVSENRMSVLSMRTVQERAEILLIKDKNPWNSYATETVLGNLGLTYETVTIESATDMDFDRYRLIIVANDQVNSFYRTLSSIRTKLELFVMNGGTLLYGICDAGWGAGYSDLLIPGDVQLGPVSYQNNNYIVDEGHPVVNGVLTGEEPLADKQLYNTWASHRYFEVSSLPADANIVLNAGSDKPTLIEYPIGNGIVIASALTWEHSYDHSSTNFGRQKYDDLLLYAYMMSSVVTEINKSPGLGFDEYINGLTCTAGDPVNVANGNFITGHVDLFYEGFVTINFSRYYNSLDTYQGELGKNWRCNYNIYLEQLSERRLRLWHRDGHSEDFIFGDDGIWYATPGTYSRIEADDSCITVTLKDKTMYQFDSTHKLVLIKEPYDNEIRFEYNDNGQMVLAEQGEFWFRYFYEKELLTEVVDKSGRKIKFQYRDGNLVSVEGYDGQIAEYEYDDVGRMTKIHINGEYTIENIYDEYGRVVEQAMAQEGICRFIYDDENGTTTYIDKNGATTIYYKDSLGRIYKKEYMNGSEVLKFDSNNKLVQKTDKLGNSIHYTYDAEGNCISETNALGGTTSYEFDPQGNRTAMTDAEGNRFEYTYDADNFLVSQSDAYGRFTYFEYNEQKQPVKIILPNQKEMCFAYDDYGNVISAVDTDGNSTFYTYNEMNQVVKEVDANGNVIEYEYSNFGRTRKTIYEDGTFTVSVFDDADRLLEYTDELGNQQSYVYNTIGLLTEVRNGGNTTTYEYDCMNHVSKVLHPDGSGREYLYDINGNLIQIKDEEGYRTSYKYDANGNIMETTDGNGNTTRYHYDAQNRITAVTDARGNTTTREYSPNGNLSVIVDGAGNRQQYEYNKNGQVIKWTNEAGETESYEYDAVGCVIAATDAGGNMVKYEYNGAGNITKIIYPDESSVSISYDGLGNMVSYVEPNGSKTQYVYDKKNLLLKEQYADGTAKEYEYDAAGNRTGSRDENGNLTVFEYDCSNRLIKVIDAMGNETRYQYDTCNNLVEMIQYVQVPDTVIDAMKSGKGTVYHNSVKELVTQYEYDKRSQLVKEISPGGQTVSYQYDANGNMVCKMDADRITTKYEYDAVNNIVSIQYGEEKTVEYQYNAVNHVVGMTDWNGKTTYELDAVGRILSVTDSQNRKLQYEWNTNNQKSLIVYPDNSTVSYEYDSKNQLVRVDDSVLGLTKYEYDINGNVVKVTAPNGTKTINTYDNMSRLIKKTDYDSSNKVVDYFTYHYDNVGNKISICRDKKLSFVEKAADESDGTTLYEYDACNRLISQTNSRNVKEKYFYDSLGNRVRKETWSKSGYFTAVCDYSYNEENQMESVMGSSELVYGTLAVRPVEMEYDGRGNLVKVSQNQTKLAAFVYDETNTMVQSTNRLGLVTEYGYDGNGARISKTTRLPDNFESLSAGMRAQMNASLAALCEESVVNTDKFVSGYYINDVTSDYNNVLLSYGNYSRCVRYTYGLDILGTASGSNGVIDWNEDLETPFDYNSKYNVYYFLDEQGTPMKLTGQSGRVVGKYSYDEYGNPGVGTYLGSFASGNSVIGYAGYQYDNETGLYFVQARYYNPGTGNFVSRDAFHGILTQTQSLNRYAYCYGNPVNYVDPSGYYTNYEGMIAHQELQTFFRLYYNTVPGVFAYTEYNVYGIETNKSFWGRADMVLDKGQILEVYEIKPRPDKNVGSGRAQLQGYINALNTYGIKSAVKGTGFLPVARGLKLPYPPDPTRIITYYTYPDDAGMIYYYISSGKKKNPVQLPAVVPQKEPARVDTQDICEGVLVAGGTVAVGYLIYRAIRLLPSLTPWTFWSLPGNLVTP